MNHIEYMPMLMRDQCKGQVLNIYNAYYHLPNVARCEKEMKELAQITTIDELRNAVEQIETQIGIVPDNRIAIRDRVSHVLNVADLNRKTPEPTHNGVAGYIGEIYALKDLEIVCEVLTNTDRYKLRRDNKGRFTGGYVTESGDQIY